MKLTIEKKLENIKYYENKIIHVNERMKNERIFHRYTHKFYEDYRHQELITELQGVVQKYENEIHKLKVDVIFTSMFDDIERNNKPIEL